MGNIQLREGIEIESGCRDAAPSGFPADHAFIPLNGCSLRGELGENRVERWRLAVLVDAGVTCT